MIKSNQLISFVTDIKSTSNFCGGRILTLGKSDCPSSLVWMLVCLCVLPWTLAMLSWPHPLLSSSLCVTWPLSQTSSWSSCPRPPAGLPSSSFTAAAPEGCTSGGGGGDRGRKETQTELVVQVEVEGRANDGFVRVELRPVLAGYLQIVEVLFSESLISFMPFLEPGISRS